MAREQTGKLVTGGGNSIQRVVVTPISPGTIETADRPFSFGFLRGYGTYPGRGGQRTRSRRCGLNKDSTVHQCSTLLLFEYSSAAARVRAVKVIPSNGCGGIPSDRDHLRARLGRCWGF